MRRLAMAGLTAILLVVGLAAPAEAGGGRRHHGHASADIALGLASFAVFNQVMMGPFLYDRYRTVVYDRAYAPPVVYYPQPYYHQPAVVVAAPMPTPLPPQTVYYPHGRHEFHVNQWVWIPNTPPTPSPPPAAESCQPTGRYVKTPYGLQPECR